MIHELIMYTKNNEWMNEWMCIWQAAAEYSKTNAFDTGQVPMLWSAIASIIIILVFTVKPLFSVPIFSEFPYLVNTLSGPGQSPT
jgi:cytochrome b subunit of formate dehydrogenase